MIGRAGGIAALAMTGAMTMGCATPTATPAGGEEATPPVAGAGLCRADGMTRFAGRPGTAELGAEVLRATGARTLRWIRPGDAVTMDFREDRVNIDLDERGRVLSIRCG